jgi:hypothetical protein
MENNQENSSEIFGKCKFGRGIIGLDREQFLIPRQYRNVFYLCFCPCSVCDKSVGDYNNVNKFVAQEEFFPPEKNNKLGVNFSDIRSS